MNGCHPRQMGRLGAGLAALGLALALHGCGPAPQAPPSGGALFSWSEEVLAGEGRERLFAAMETCGLSVLYQELSADAAAGDVRAFLRAAARERIAVYLLAGRPEWGLDPAGTEMAAQVERCAAYNRGLPAAARLRGVMMDTEPYLTQAWELDARGTMAAYVSGMAAAHAAAGEAGLQYGACIPWFYDTKGLEAELGELIASGCDLLAVMNYQKRDEAGQIETEAALAKAAEVPVTVIYELQPPGTHDLTEYNTYRLDGLQAVEESFRALEERFGGLSCALHDESALQEVLRDA